MEVRVSGRGGIREWAVRPVGPLPSWAGGLLGRGPVGGSFFSFTFLLIFFLFISFWFSLSFLLFLGLAKYQNDT